MVACSWKVWWWFRLMLLAVSQCLWPEIVLLYGRERVDENSLVQLWREPFQDELRAPQWRWPIRRSRDPRKKASKTYQREFKVLSSLYCCIAFRVKKKKKFNFSEQPHLKNWPHRSIRLCVPSLLPMGSSSCWVRTLCLCAAADRVCRQWDYCGDRGTTQHALGPLGTAEAQGFVVGL